MKKRALICGASSGIGRATALAMAADGISVIALARRRPRLESLQAEMTAHGFSQPEILVCDLSNVEESINAVKVLLCDGPIHILVNNSSGPPSGSILSADISAFQRAFSQHVLAAHRLMQLLVPGMVAADYGRIINVISTSVREPIPNLGVSNTIRGAMAAWAKSVSRELPPKITINNVLPGFTDTERLRDLRAQWASNRGIPESDLMGQWLEQVPEGRLAQPSETAAAICFLASEAAGYIRGTSLPVDGGRMRGI